MKKQTYIRDGMLNRVLVDILLRFVTKRSESDIMVGEKYAGGRDGP